MKLNSENERIKHRYRGYLKEAKQLGEHSIDAVEKALDRFEDYTRRRDFRDFRPEQAVAFKRHLGEQRGIRTAERLSKATIYSTLNALREFFFWLAGQPGFRARLNYSDADYFKASLKDTAIAKAGREPRVPTLDQIRTVLGAMPASSSIEKRNRALIAFTILTGARDDAVASMRLKHLDLAERQVFQDARDVRTKFSKTFSTWFFPVGEEIEAIVAGWKGYLQTALNFGPEDALFPQTKVGIAADGSFGNPELARAGWANAQPIRSIFKDAFEAAGLPYFNPHSFRNTLVQLGMEICRTPAELKAWSQNLGHEAVLTTLTSYGTIPAHRQRDLIRATTRDEDEDAKALRFGRDVLRTMRASGVQ
jgi:integrase